MKIKNINKDDNIAVDEIVDIHIATFTGFFLTFMGKGFLRVMYGCYCTHNESGLVGAFDDDNLLGFLAYSKNMSGLYKHMLKNKFLSFIWYSLLAFLRKPKIFLRLFRALLKPSESNRNEKYIEISSIGVKPAYKSKGIGTQLIDYIKKTSDLSKYKYINLETDAVDNDDVNEFYVKNGFELSRTYLTAEGRKMNEYRWSNRE